MRVLILGGTGMLGHKLAQVLTPHDDVIVTMRGDAVRWPKAIEVAHVEGNTDVRDTARLTQLLETYRPQAVLNAAGVVKQVAGERDPEEVVAINAMYPRVLAGMCERAGARLIHYSTDCVYSGNADSARGPCGYRETDPPDARDLYGMTKLLGEPGTATSLVLRTSMIGRELRGRSSLIEWFLNQGDGPVKGFTRALFTGLPTLELARVTAMLLKNHPDMSGVWHVAAAPIDKKTLLELVRATYGLRVTIQPGGDFFCDRRLDGTRFGNATGWIAPAWPEMIRTMYQDPFNYENL